MNIFAHQLADILLTHDYTINNLYRHRLEIPPNTVTRLLQSLNQNKTATLNIDQIDFLQKQYELSDAEVQRLRAALIAETVHRLMAGRLDADAAYAVGMVTLQLLLAETDEETRHARDILLTSIRSQPILPKEEDIQHNNLPTEAFSVAEALTDAEEALHQGMLWLEVARDTKRPDRHSYATLALTFLNRALDYTHNCIQVAQGSIVQQNLLAQITAAIDDANTLVR